MGKRSARQGRARARSIAWEVMVDPFYHLCVVLHLPISLPCIDFILCGPLFFTQGAVFIAHGLVI